MQMHVKIASSFIVLIILLTGCRINVSTTGASISPESETVSIAYFPNRASLGPPTIGQDFTNDLQDRFIDQTRLTLVQEEGDLSFRGAITGFSTQPVAIQGNEVAAQNRLTITVHVVFTNKQNPEYNFEQDFSQYEDYAGDKMLTEVESTLVPSITEKLIEDIFNKAVVNW
jgi:hypothetical protein